MCIIRENKLKTASSVFNTIQRGRGSHGHTWHLPHDQKRIRRGFHLACKSAIKLQCAIRVLPVAFPRFTRTIASNKEAGTKTKQFLIRRCLPMYYSSPGGFTWTTHHLHDE